MAENRGKKFEKVIKESFLKIQDVSVDRLHDQTNGFAGSSNICDYIVYKKPHEFYIECKSVHGNTLSIHGNNPKNRYGNITNKQWEGLLDKSCINGVIAGVMCWWVDRDVTMFIPIQVLERCRGFGMKSIRYDFEEGIEIKGRKKRVFFDYDMTSFFEEVEQWNRNRKNE